MKTNNGYSFQVDEDDILVIHASNWCGITQRKTDKNGTPRKPYKYIVRFVNKNGKRTSELLHRVLLNAPSGTEVDHRNGDTLDYRRSNLRLCTHSQNQANSKIRSDNSSGFKGVFWNKTHKRWQAKTRLNGKTRHFGMFCSLRDAVLAYNKGASELFGEFARINDLKALEGL